jgi:hypothetical protein
MLGMNENQLDQYRFLLTLKEIRVQLIVLKRGTGERLPAPNGRVIYLSVRKVKMCSSRDAERRMLAYIQYSKI